MHSELDLCDIVSNKLSERDGILHTLIHFPQIQKLKASLTLSLSWTQAQLPSSRPDCVHSLRATPGPAPQPCTAPWWHRATPDPALPSSAQHPSDTEPLLLSTLGGTEPLLAQLCSAPWWHRALCSSCGLKATTTRQPHKGQKGPRPPHRQEEAGWLCCTEAGAGSRARATKTSSRPSYPAVCLLNTQKCRGLQA